MKQFYFLSFHNKSDHFLAYHNQGFIQDFFLGGGGGGGGCFFSFW